MGRTFFLCIRNTIRRRCIFDLSVLGGVYSGLGEFIHLVMICIRSEGESIQLFRYTSSMWDSTEAGGTAAEDKSRVPRVKALLTGFYNSVLNTSGKHVVGGLLGCISSS